MLELPIGEDFPRILSPWNRQKHVQDGARATLHCLPCCYTSSVKKHPVCFFYYLGTCYYLWNFRSKFVSKQRVVVCVVGRSRVKKRCTGFWAMVWMCFNGTPYRSWSKAAAWRMSCTETWQKPAWEALAFWHCGNWSLQQLEFLERNEALLLPSLVIIYTPPHLTFGNFTFYSTWCIYFFRMTFTMKIYRLHIQH